MLRRPHDRPISAATAAAWPNREAALWCTPVKVYAGIDPISKRRLHLSETVPSGPGQARLAEEVRTRLQDQVDEKRSPRSRATVDQLIDKYLAVLQADPSTLRGYQSKIRTHIRPLLGNVPPTRLDFEVLDSFYAELRRCRDHCDCRPRRSASNKE
jgi:hypothetical protein